MRFAISITDMTAAELVAVSSFVASMDGTPVERTVAELATMTPPRAPAPMMGIPQPGAPTPVHDPFAAPQMPQPGSGAPTPPPAPAPIPTHDVRGVPHNPEFHAESKRQTKEGRWARRKGVDGDACDRWEASVSRGAPSVPQTPPPAPAAPAPTAAEINAQFAPGLPPQGATAPDPFAAPAAPQAPTPPPAPAPLADVTYATWHGMYMSLLTAGKMTPEKYTEIATRYGAVEDVMKFMNDADARARSYRDFEALAAA